MQTNCDIVFHSHSFHILNNNSKLCLSNEKLETTNPTQLLSFIHQPCILQSVEDFDSIRKQFRYLPSFHRCNHNLDKSENDVTFLKFYEKIKTNKSLKNEEQKIQKENNQRLFFLFSMFSIYSGFIFLCVCIPTRSISTLTYRNQEG